MVIEVKKEEALGSVESAVKEALKTRSVGEVRSQFDHATLWDKLLDSDE